VAGGPRTKTSPVVVTMSVAFTFYERAIIYSPCQRNDFRAEVKLNRELGPREWTGPTVWRVLNGREGIIEKVSKSSVKTRYECGN